jgi:hypothetical protein
MPSLNISPWMTSLPRPLQPQCLQEYVLLLYAKKLSDSGLAEGSDEYSSPVISLSGSMAGINFWNLPINEDSFASFFRNCPNPAVRENKVKIPGSYFKRIICGPADYEFFPYQHGLSQFLTGFTFLRDPVIRRFWANRRLS